MQFAEALERDWARSIAALPAVFTTQDYVNELKKNSPQTWSAITERHGPGARVVGAFISLRISLLIS